MVGITKKSAEKNGRKLNARSAESFSNHQDARPDERDDLQRSLYLVRCGKRNRSKSLHAKICGSPFDRVEERTTDHDEWSSGKERSRESWPDLPLHSRKYVGLCKAARGGTARRSIQGDGRPVVPQKEVKVRIQCADRRAVYFRWVAGEFVRAAIPESHMGRGHGRSGAGRISHQAELPS